jgi:hypothetical protein
MNKDLGSLITLTAAGAGTTTSGKKLNQSSKGIKLVIDITALSGTLPTLTVTLRGYDPTTGKSYTILASAALAAQATTVLSVYPGLTAASNLVANDHLPLHWDVSVLVVGTLPAVTANITATLLI